MGYKQLNKISGWLVFAIATIVYMLTAEPTGSLWDCGEFITGAHKMEVVHPPGAPVYLLIGKMFALIGDTFSDNPENISYAVNVMSGVCTAVCAMMVCWVTMIFGRIALVGKEGEPDQAQTIALAGAGIIAGLSTAFCSSIWFSAVEGEVYAMSTMFTSLVVWGMAKWYSLPDTRQADRWIVFSMYMAGLSMGVHLLSLLTFPALAILYYLKKFRDINILGMGIAAFCGVLVMVFLQYFIIIGIPTMWTWFEYFTVNSMGMPKHSGAIPLAIFLIGVIAAGLWYAPRLGLPQMQTALVALANIIVAFSTFGIIVIRANANTPINMNEPSNAYRLLPYLNREQYGERPLLMGPQFNIDPEGVETEDRLDYVAESGKYEITDQKISYEYPSGSSVLFPRISHTDRANLYMERFGMSYKRNTDGSYVRDPRTGAKVLSREPNMVDNLGFFINYQIGWMYVRYFMWNFSGKQNGKQGHKSWDAAKGHWISGIKPIDAMRTHSYSNMTDVMKEDEARNTYFMLPFLFGLLGIIYFFMKRRNEALALVALFLMTGLAIIVYSNQPPSEPRERDYVLVGSFFTYCMWIGFGALALFDLLRSRANLSGTSAAAAGVGIVMIAPLLMGWQNWDDHSRANHYGARDYASNFLNSVDENAIIFTYGDNDTYPLWYAQEVEGIRTDVRVVNLSLIQVDWYINQLRRKVNDSEPIAFSIPKEKLRGKLRNQLLIQGASKMNLKNAIRYIGEDHPVTTTGGTKMASSVPSSNFYLPVDTLLFKKDDIVTERNKGKIASSINFSLGSGKRSLLKGETALLDIIASNLDKRPIYFAVTVRKENLLGLDRYLQLEGLALRLVPTSSPQDDKFGPLGALGLGSVHADKLFENVTTRWRYGNFDKVEMYVDDKYGPSTQSMHYAILRGAEALLSEGKRDKAIALINKYFEAFPNMNFPYDYATVAFIRLYHQAGAKDLAKPHWDLLVNNLRQELDFLDSLDGGTMSNSETFKTDRAFAERAIQQLEQIAQASKDPALIEQIKTTFGR